MINILIVLISTIIGGFFIKNIVTLILTQKKGFVYNIITLFFYMIVIGNRNWIGDENPIIILPFFIIIFLLSFENIWYEKLISSLILYSLFLSFNMISDTLFYDFIKSDGTLIILLNTMMKFIMIFISGFIFKKLLNNHSIQLSKKLWYILGGLILAPFVMVITSTSLGINRFENNIVYTQAISKAMLILPFAFFSAFTILMAMAILSKHEYLVEQENLSKLREIYFEGIKNEQQQINIIKHDMKNHFQTLEIMLEQNKKNDAINYLNNLSEKNVLRETNIFSNNNIVNIIFSNKINKIKNNNIKLNYKINLKNNISISDIDLSSILSNAIDNAIEGSTNSKEKFIDIILKSEKGLFILKINNSYNHKIILKNNKFQTTKENKKLHGLGISSMTEIVQRYNGFIDIKTKDNIFELLISIPIE